WVLESHTHFPPAGYGGHSTDRLLVFYDVDGNGKADRRSIFADGIVHAMSVLSSFDDGLYLATRKEVLRFPSRDSPNRQVILRLETTGNYPHNGLAGFAFDGLGFLYIGLGENLGVPYRLVGSDGREHRG